MGVILEKEGHIARVGLRVPETKNALGPDVLLDLYRAWEECGRDDAVRAVVLYSGLPDIFCSGMDLRTAIPILTGVRAPETEGEKWLISDADAVGKSMLKLKDLDRPVIAAVHGLCITGGFELVMGCELRVASDDAVFQMRETTLGIMPVGGSNVFLPMQVGQTRALEILLTGENFTAQQLYDWGFINRVAPRGRYMDEAMALAERIAGNGPRSIRGMVRCSRAIQGKSLEEAMKAELEIGAPIFMSEDAREGVRAQREKRRPEFK
ncbi:MAG: crotonase/enoyl-CoA hydratase family protein [Spirochaetales bacterium]|nr:MAG: crotonase/enoyl-CoA hydratase family protein [Spirochaetales bacterium]